MKRVLIPALLIPVAMLAACAPSAPVTETYLMNLDTIPNSTNLIEVPSSIKAEAAMKVRVSVSFGGCEEFSKFDSKRTNDQLELKPIGIRQLNVPCPAIAKMKLVEFEDSGLPRSNPFKVIVRRGNGTDLEKSVTVTP
jgi:hypothetical protein